ncbi:MAG: hypothetical protein ACKN9V_04600 [Pseudomonadota bacterium]
MTIGKYEILNKPISITQRPEMKGCASFIKTNTIQEMLRARTSKGFGLVEVMVALGLLAGLSLFMAKIVFQGQKTQKRLTANFDFTSTMWEVFNVLQDPNFCSSNTNLVFREKNAGGLLNPAKLSNEDTPAMNTVNWIGYRLGTGGAVQDIKVLAEGDVIENTLTVSGITFERQQTDAVPPVIVPAVPDFPNSGKTTHHVNLVITANPTSGAGFPVTKTFKIRLVTDSSSNNVVGCGPETNPTTTPTTTPTTATPTTPTAPDGKLLQIRYVESNTELSIPTTSTSPDPTPVPALLLDFTPISSNSIIEIAVNLSAGFDHVGCFAIFKNGNPTVPNLSDNKCGNGQMNVTRYNADDSIGGGDNNSAAFMHGISFSKYEINTSTAARTYQVYVSNKFDGGTGIVRKKLRINNREYTSGSPARAGMQSYSTLTIREYAP